MDDDVRQRLERLEARVEELAVLVTGGPAVADPAGGTPPPVQSDQCVAERCMHPGEALTDANSMTVHPKGPDGEADRSARWPIHRACFSPARHVVA